VQNKRKNQKKTPEKQIWSCKSFQLNIPPAKHNIRQGACAVAPSTTSGREPALLRQSDFFSHSSIKRDYHVTLVAALVKKESCACAPDIHS
jgi:hypothetical protein